MSRPLEHDYIGLSEVSLMENSESYLLSKNSNNGGLKTELSLGLPGAESPERKHGGVTIFGKDFEGKSQTLYSCLNGSLKGSKRGFSDAIDGCGKWVLSINGGSDGNFSKDGFLGENLNKNAHNLGLLKEVSVTSCTKTCVQEKPSHESSVNENGAAPASKAQVVGWPPIRSFRKNTMASTSAKNTGNTEEKSASECLYVKVSMDGAPYLRKVDLRIYRNYVELSLALEKMFSCFISGPYGSHGHGKHDVREGHSTEYLRTSEYVLTYEDKDGDWMLVGDVPWKMFTENCRKLRIMKGSEAIGLGMPHTSA
ncbi:hypothetical protein KSS87_001641 [Heliosperma pusillum]|nr:hypothetical protein KSS87_001641 [Heliosperma pusillum]